jgi:polygalacturonase
MADAVRPIDELPMRHFPAVGAVVLGLILVLAFRAGAMPPTPGEFLTHIPYDAYIDRDRAMPVGAVFDVRDFGAVGDGATVNSDAINRAVQAAHAQGGGTVLVEGGDYVSGTIVLKSNVTLRIAKDTVLRASRDAAHYAPLHLIFAEHAENVGIEGPGRILGEGEAWWQPPRMHPPQTPPDVFDLEEVRSAHFASKRPKLANRPSPFLRFRECRDVFVRNLIIENSPGWTLVMDLCDRVQIRDVIINNNYHGANTDGINIVGSSNVDVTHCFVSTGDDGIVLKNGFAGDKSRAMSNIRISECAVRSSTNCFKIGTETWSDIADVRVSDSTFFVDEIWPGALSGIAIESVDGAKVRHITAENITMRNVMAPIFIRLGNRNRWESKDRQGALEHVTIKNVTATDAEFPCVVSGIPGLRINDVTLDSIAITYRDAKERLQLQDPIPEAEDQYPEFWMFGDLPAYGLFARHVDGLTLHNFHVTPRTVNERELLVFEDVLNPGLKEESR